MAKEIKEMSRAELEHEVGRWRKLSGPTTAISIFITVGVAMYLESGSLMRAAAGGFALATMFLACYYFKKMIEALF